MLASFVKELGPWSWMVFGFVLLTLEIMVPGVFLLWIGIAAIIVGAMSLVFWDAAIWSSPLWTWQVQTVTFLVLSVISVLAGRYIMAKRGNHSEQPVLNRRSDQRIGRIATLTEPIRDGRGRVQLGDTTWRVAGPDLPAGTAVRVVQASETDLDLIVEPAKAQAV